MIKINEKYSVIQITQDVYLLLNIKNKRIISKMDKKTLNNYLKIQNFLKQD